MQTLRSISTSAVIPSTSVAACSTTAPLGLPHRRPAIAIVSNETVAPLYLERLSRRPWRLSAEHHIVLPDGEAHKNWETLQLIFDGLLARGCDRKTVMFALGGGVIGDMTGFVAASYMRGVPFVQVPTTLLAQVDSSVGGKTGDQPPAGQEHDRRLLPAAARADATSTRWRRCRRASCQRWAGRGHQVRADLRTWRSSTGSRSNVEALLRARSRSPGARGHAAPARSRPRWSAQDEREAGLRAILNFGHTFGHAIEADLGYGDWLHGEAVGGGMVMAAAAVAHAWGWSTTPWPIAFTRLVGRAGLPVQGPRLGADRYLELMRRGQEGRGGRDALCRDRVARARRRACRTRSAGARGDGALHGLRAAPFHA